MDFLSIPGVVVDEETKRIIDLMFDDSGSNETQHLQKELESGSPEPKQVRHRVRIPETPKQTKLQEDISLAHVDNEFEIIRNAFLSFSEATHHTVLYGHLYNQIQELAQSFQDMETLLHDNIRKEDLTQYGLENYEKLRAIRSRVLGDIYREYEKE